MDPISTILGLATTILNKIWGNKDDELKRQFILELQEKLDTVELTKGQLEINKVEAANENLFVSGARPFIMWVCGFAFAWMYVVQPMITYLVVVTGNPMPILPVFNTTELMTVLFGLLGLGGMRSFDKLNRNKK